MIAEATVHDYDGAVEFLGRVARHVEENLPNTLTWDVFMDQTAGRLVMYEEFTDESALLEYEMSMTDHGLRQEIGKYAHLDRVLALGPLSDPGMLGMLGQMGGVHVDYTLGATR